MIDFFRNVNHHGNLNCHKCLSTKPGGHNVIIMICFFCRCFWTAYTFARSRSTLFDAFLPFHSPMILWEPLTAVLRSFSRSGTNIVTTPTVTILPAGHSSSIITFLGTTKQSSNKCTPFMRPQRLPLWMRIREPWFSTIYNWRTRSIHYTHKV